MGFLLLLGLIFFMSSPCVELISASDRLQRGRPVSVNQTIVSTGGNFALGFFLPGNSIGKFYAGIWYNNLPGRTVVWVANREKPLLDPSGVLAIAPDGNISVLDSEGSVVWSSNASAISGNATAVLQDDGNLVLRAEEGSAVVWQSFDHPTDTLLPGMKLRRSSQSNLSSTLIGWRDVEDPSPGNFSFGIDPRTTLQLIIWRGSEIRARSQVWTGNQIGATRDPISLSIFLLSLEANGEETSVKFSAAEGSTAGRIVLDFTGYLKGLLWDNRTKNWTVVASEPRPPCEIYNACGPASVCNSSNPSLSCSCLRGFEPRNMEEWKEGNFTAGCARRVPFNCDEGDWFLKSDGLRMPDGFVSVRNMSAIELCEGECSRRCSCSAYAYSNLHISGAVSQCLIWIGEMLDIAQVDLAARSLYVRLPAANAGDRRSSRRIILLLVILPTFASAMVLVGICCSIRKRAKKKEMRASKEVILGNWSAPVAVQGGKDAIDLRFMDFGSVMAATDNFSGENKLGEGGFGPVYRGRLPQGEEIAVKRLSKRSGQGIEEFQNEVELIARLQHRNLVRLVAWCTHQEEKILIYEYLPNKSLDKYIFDPERSRELDWGKRTRIIEGIAQGLLYLHRYSRLRIIHRDLKASNILLDDAMNPKISDFGLARIFGGNQTQANTDKIVGTIGYMSPEYALNGLFSEKSDVFSFGVIILEIVSGEKSSGFYHFEEALSLLGYAWRLWQQGRGLELVDSSITGTVHEGEALRFITVGLLCTQENPAHRPSMSSVISMLGNEQAALPSPTYPPFFEDRGAKLTVGTLFSSQSVNEVTNTDVYGR
ncbi:unnamed protein product [Spirodela intermedia]|uniref:Receptor-like serine/threonine-protein kinase n=1 Tax=Spirodela intermedia TaxID=51605 RepID=A0A7I8LIM0_SPIIN|nr:unnamed protein product [Spirodela intermedia]